MSGKVRDLAEFHRSGRMGAAPSARSPRPTTTPATGARQHTRQPRDLLRAIPGLTLVEVPDAGTCCGSAGVYNLLQPAAASELGARKAESVQSTGAPLLISANPGCSLQIAFALAERGQDIAVAHTAEV
jgi:glycolate oxidase iron-sulfur subunit